MITYRKATSSDAESLCPLIFEVSFMTRFLYGSLSKNSNLSETELYDFIYPPLLKDTKDTGYKNIYVAEYQDSEIVGLIKFHDSTQHQLSSQMRHQHAPETIQIVEPLYQSIISDSVYVATLIVKKAFRNSNIGLALLDQAKTYAKQLQRQYVSLHVWEDNIKGIQFYKKNNFIFHDALTLKTDSPYLPPSKKLYLTSILAETETHALASEF